MDFPPKPVNTLAAQWVLAALLGVTLIAAFNLRQEPTAVVTAAVIVLIVVAVMLPGARLRYRVEGRALHVRSILGTRTYPLLSARADAAVLGPAVRVGGWSGLNGHLGRFQFRELPGVACDVVASDLSGTVVVVSFVGRAPLVLSPDDPEGFVLAVDG